jgi:aldehyde:ferredoxin oxidoreductase
MIEGDPLRRVLYVDLTKKIFYIKDRKDLFEKWLGGVGVGIQLLLEECPPGIDPFSPENPIIFTVGPLNALFPVASKTIATFKSPHTGNLGESHAGGRSAIAIRMAGYGGIVIKGKSEKPVYIVVDGDKVYFRDASALWGMSTFATGRVIRENERGAGFRTIMRIGKAGEELITYSSVTTETYRHFGRLGLGAVFGSKKLKAVVVVGKRQLPVSSGREYRILYDKIFKLVVESPAMKKYHELGTPENVIPLNKIGALPIKNLKEASSSEAENISGERILRDYLGRRIACSHCPTGCIHIAALREPYKDEPYFYKTSMISYDYEPIYALGTMLGIFDPEGFLKLLDEVEKIGMDAMSTGVILAWATEAFEKKLISKEETMGLELKWGDYETYIFAVRNILKGENEFYRALRRGVEYASSIYGGKEFAMAMGGNEMPGYHTGPGCHIGALVGSRHGHLDNAGYSIDQDMLKKNRILSPEELGAAILKEEGWRQILSSLVLCFFARGIYTPEIVSETLRVSGFELSPAELQELGEKIHKEKYKFKLREGFSFEDLRIPERIFQTRSALGEISKEYMMKTIEYIKKKLV